MSRIPSETITPRIYVACLAAYNNGVLHGRWIDAEQGADALRAEIAAMLKASPIAGAEEYAIHDYEGFEGVALSEYQGLDSVADLAAFIAEHGELGGALLAHFGGDLADAKETLEDRYHGAHTSLADYVQDLNEQSVQIPEALRFYIDWGAMARDAELNGDLFAIRTDFETVHVFSGS